MVDVGDLVRGHYGGPGLEEAILRALRDAGTDVDALTVEDLAPVDELHAGGLPATTYLLEQLDLDPLSRLLDVGCGIGGPSRFAADTYTCPVVGVDLAPDFIEVARSLTDRVGLSALVDHHVSSGDSLDFPDGSFDHAIMIHVGMNIPAKEAVFAEVRRVLRPGGVLGLFEQMRTSDAAPTYPLPWAEDERSSFVASAQEYAEQLSAAGFTVERTEDRTAAAFGPPGGPGGLSPAAVFGPAFTERIGNNIAATRDGILAPILIIARAT